MYSLDPYAQEPGNYLFQLFDYALHVGGLPALRAAYTRLDARGQAVWRKYLRLLRWPPELVNQVLHGKGDSLCEVAGGGYELYKALAGGRVKLDFSLVVEAARCLRQPYLLRCSRARVAPRVLLLDEFQDLSPALRNLVVRIFPDVEYVVLAGDDDQLIYDSLHGASADVTLKIVEMIQRGEIPGEYHVLAKSFRVPEKPIAEVARRIIEAVPNRVRKIWRGRPEPGRILRIHRSQLRTAVETELAAGKKVFVLTADNATAQSLMLELLEFLPAGLKGLPGSLRKLYTDLLEYFKKRSSLVAYLKEAGQERANPDVSRFLEMIRGWEEEAVKIIKTALDTEKALERLEKLRLFVDTAHAAKGLEADVVFIANFTTSEKFVNNRRLTYVALTRARERVYIVEDEEGKRWLADL
jgi:superfamily I DNA/RNA helicase